MSAEQAVLLRDAANIVHARGEYDLSYQLQSVAVELEHAEDRATNAMGSWD